MGEITVSITHLPCGHMGKGEILPPSMPEAGGRAGPELIRTGESSLPLISCSTQKSGPYTYLGSTVELALKALPLAHHYKEVT